MKIVIHQRSVQTRFGPPLLRVGGSVRQVRGSRFLNRLRFQRFLRNRFRFAVPVRFVTFHETKRRLTFLGHGPEAGSWGLGAGGPWAGAEGPTLAPNTTQGFVGIYSWRYFGGFREVRQFGEFWVWRFKGFSRFRGCRLLGIGSHFLFPTISC